MFPSGVFSEGIGTGLIGLLVLFVLFLSLFARGRTVWVFVGFMKIFWAIFVEPILYLGRIIQQFSHVGMDNLHGTSGRRQGLLGTFLFYLQAVLMIGAIGILSMGAYISWKVLQPPVYAEKQLEEARKELAQIKQNLDATQLTLRTHETGMTQKKAEMVTLFKGERQKTIQTADLEMTAAEKSAEKDANLADALGKIKTFLADKSAPTNRWEPENAREKVDSFINSNVVGEDAAKAPLLTYSQHWQLKMIAQMELASFDEGQIARQMEQEHQELIQKAASLESEFKAQAQVVEKSVEAASFRFGAAFMTLLATFGQFIVFIWVTGLFLELFEKALLFSRHMAEIRNHLKGEAFEAVPVEDGAGAEAGEDAITA